MIELLILLMILVLIIDCCLVYKMESDIHKIKGLIKEYYIADLESNLKVNDAIRRFMNMPPLPPDGEKEKKRNFADDIKNVMNYSPSPKRRMEQKRERE